MNPWIDIDTRWEPHIAIRPKLMKVVHKVYEDYDPNCPPPDRSPSLAYQLEPEDLLEPCVVIVNLHDSQRKGVHFMINLNNNHIRDKYKEESFHAPSELSSVFSELRQYIRGLLRYNQERKEAAERRQREDEEKRHKAKLKKLKEQMVKEKSYYSRLVKKGHLKLEKYRKYRKGESDWRGTCPLCVPPKTRAKLIACIGCGILTCGNTDCLGHSVDGIESCNKHPNRAYCKDCIEDEDGIAKLIACPDCDVLFCRYDLFRWCVGRPLTVARVPRKSGSKLNASQKASASRTRPQHAKKLAPCEGCIVESDGWNQCAEDSCWSRKGGWVCEDCSPAGGRGCSSGHIWICDECSAADQPSVWECPTCDELLCDYCSGIDRCGQCGSSSVCANCTRRGSTSGHSDSESGGSESGDSETETAGTSSHQISSDSESSESETETESFSRPRMWKCEGCGEKLCAGCVNSNEGNAVSCENCDSQVCHDCANTDSCIREDCKVEMCTLCDSNACESCSHDYGENQEGEEFAQWEDACLEAEEHGMNGLWPAEYNFDFGDDAYDVNL